MLSIPPPIVEMCVKYVTCKNDIDQVLVPSLSCIPCCISHHYECPSSKPSWARNGVFSVIFEFIQCPSIHSVKDKIGVEDCFIYAFDLNI